MTERPLQEYSTTLPNYSIGNKCYELIDKITAPYGTKAVVVGGPRSMAAFRAEFDKANQKIIITDYIIFSREADPEEAAELAKDPRVQSADMIFSVGGGRSMDFGKVLAMEAGKFHFTFPTIAGTCAPITRVAVLYDKDHHYLRNAIAPKPPVHCFINTKIIAEAPVEYIWAGIGDTLAKNYESHFASRGHELDHANMLGLTIAPISSEGLVMYGTKAMEDCQAKKTSYELEQAVLAIIVSTGLVSINVLDEYNGSLGHSIYYGLTNLKEIEEHHLHGEVVSYGVLVLLSMDHQIEERNKLYKFMRTVNLPCCLNDLHITLEDVESVMDKIVGDKQIRVVPYKITPELVKQAVVDLENYNSGIRYYEAHPEEK